MSLTLTLSGKSTVLAANYFPAIDLSDEDYELGLAIFETYHTILNESNNKFYFTKDDVEITIPKGSYEVRDINEFLKRAILRKRKIARFKNSFISRTSNVVHTMTRSKLLT